jgi:hypothetical protein
MDGIPISHRLLGRLIPGERFDDLPSDPLGSRDAPLWHGEEPSACLAPTQTKQWSSLKPTVGTMNRSTSTVPTCAKPICARFRGAWKTFIDLIWSGPPVDRTPRPAMFASKLEETRPTGGTGTSKAATSSAILVCPRTPVSPENAMR